VGGGINTTFFGGEQNGEGKSLVAGAGGKRNNNFPDGRFTFHYST